MKGCHLIIFSLIFFLGCKKDSIKEEEIVVAPSPLEKIEGKYVGVKEISDEYWCFQNPDYYAINCASIPIEDYQYSMINAEYPDSILITRVSSDYIKIHTEANTYGKINKNIFIDSTLKTTLVDE